MWDDYTAPKARERILPTGTVDIVINLRGAGTSGQFPGIVVYGAQSEYRVIETPPGLSVMGIHFKPGGALPFLGVPAGELQDIRVSLDVLWGRDGAILHERLLGAPSHPQRFRLLETALLSRLKRPWERHRTVEFALNRFNGPEPQAVSHVLEQTDLSPKRFIALFRREVGLPPKLYSRIRRFQHALRQIEQERRVDWSSLALAAGYFDQAHFYRDFRVFSGITPRAYLTKGVERANHVPFDA
jgi:AraC-like DNA-binding protein